MKAAIEAEKHEIASLRQMREAVDAFAPSFAIYISKIEAMNETEWWLEHRFEELKRRHWVSENAPNESVRRQAAADAQELVHDITDILNELKNHRDAGAT